MARTPMPGRQRPATTGTDLIRATAPATDRYGYPSSDDRLKPEAWVLVVFGICMLVPVAGIIQSLVTGDIGSVVGFAVVFIVPVLLRIINEQELPTLRIIVGVLAALVFLYFFWQLIPGHLDSLEDKVWPAIFAVMVPGLFIATEKLHTWRRDDVQRHRFLLFLDQIQHRTDVYELCVINRVSPNGAQSIVDMTNAVTGQGAKWKSLWDQGWQPGMVVAVDDRRRVITWTTQEDLAAANAYL